MKSNLYYFCCFVLLFISCKSSAQNISLLKQFNGRYDFTFLGNTLNTIENNSIDGMPPPPCVVLTSSSATLNLNSSDTIETAYLYWAGSGTGDFNVKLNGQDVTGQRFFSIMNANSLPCFSAFADVTTQIEATGNGNYTLSDLDVSSVISDYCAAGGNFAGWAIIIVYKNDTLPLNQLNIYDGMQSVSANNPNLSFTLNSINVKDSIGAKIGFVAWEGDKNIANNERLIFNNNVLSNALNPATNAFNGTNSITGATDLYNMDLDVYDIHDNIQIGQQTASIRLTSSQDFVMINAVVTKLNSELPDARITIDNYQRLCNSRVIDVDYTVYNTNSTRILDANVPIAIYANDTFIQLTHSLGEILMGDSQSNSISLVIPDTIPLEFTLKFVVDSDANGASTILETNENNNVDSIDARLLVSPQFNVLQNVIACNEGLGKGHFDFSGYEQLVKTNTSDVASFFITAEDASENVNSIFNSSNFLAETTPKKIFVRIENPDHCFSVTSFDLLAKNCPPKIYNLVATTKDDYYDTLQSDGLRDIFLKYKLSIYNRWGTLIWTGSNSMPDWDGTSNEGSSISGKELPDGTYYYILDLNDPDYLNAMTGFIHLTK